MIAVLLYFLDAIGAIELIHLAATHRLGVTHTIAAWIAWAGAQTRLPLLGRHTGTHTRTTRKAATTA